MERVVDMETRASDGREGHSPLSAASLMGCVDEGEELMISVVELNGNFDFWT